MVIYREDTSLPVVKIVSKKNPDTFMIINEIDFKPGVDVLWEDKLNDIREKLAIEEKELAKKELAIAEKELAEKELAEKKSMTKTKSQAVKEPDKASIHSEAADNVSAENGYADQTGIQKQ